MLPQLPVEELGFLDPSLQISARDAFLGPNDQIYLGCQSTSWQGDFTETGGCWSRWRGRWFPRSGGAPSRVVPKDLALIQSGTPISLDESGHHPVALLTANQPFQLQHTLQDENGLGSGQVEARLYNASTGTITQTVEISATVGALHTADFQGLPDGSYQLCVRVHGIKSLPLTTAQYTALTNLPVALEYYYLETLGGIEQSFFYDWRRALGRIPTDPNHPFHTLRADLVASGQQLDRPEWSPFISSALLDDGEWSFLRVKVGPGPWTIAPNVSPNPGPALRRQGTTPNEWKPVHFDSMARSVAASTKIHWGNGELDSTINTLQGDLLLGGTLATRTGPVAALWRYRPVGQGSGYNLLGYHRDPSDGRCQCAKRNHGPNTIIELRDGTVLILSECALLRYDPTAPDVSQRLTNYPDTSRETPGGYSLRLLDGAQKFNHFTENFSPSPPGEFNFYNRLQELVAGRLSTGPGTRWHGRECSAAYGGQDWGWSQDGTDDDPDAQLWLSRLVDGQWARDFLDSYPAKDFLWRQVVSCGGKLICAGTHVLNTPDAAQEFDTGKRATPIWGIASQEGWQECDSPYIPLYLTTCQQDGAQFLLAIARKVDENGLLLPAEYIIRINPGAGEELICVQYDADLQGYLFPKADLLAVGLDPDSLPPYYTWIRDITQDAGGHWQGGQLPFPDLTGTRTILLVKSDPPPHDAILYSPQCDGVSNHGFLLGQTGEPIYSQKPLPNGHKIALANPQPAGETGCLPYDLTLWGILCLTSNPNTPVIHPPCTSAGCVETYLPPGSHHKILVRENLATPWTAIEVGDLNRLSRTATLSIRRLERQASSYPNLWARIDSNAPQEDLSTYTLRVPWSRPLSLPIPAQHKIELCLLWTKTIDPITLPAIDRRA